MKVCFVGAGSIGKRHIANFWQICRENGIDPEIHLLRKRNRPLEDDLNTKISRTVHKDEQLDDRYDAVFITNPTDQHYETIELFLHRTDYFFVEKPVFLDVRKDIRRFLAEEKQFYVACPVRYTGVILAAREILKRDKAISVRAISSSYLPDWRKGIDYRETYSAHKEQGGGVMIDIIHEWDYLISLFGKPERVYCLSGKYSDLEIDSEDLAVYIAKYTDKLVELHLDYFGRTTRRAMEARTDKHEYIFDIASSEIYCDGKLIEKFHENINDKYHREMKFFYDFMHGKCSSTNDLEQAIDTVKVAKMLIEKE